MTTRTSFTEPVRIPHRIFPSSAHKKWGKSPLYLKRLRERYPDTLSADSYLFHEGFVVDSVEFSFFIQIVEHCGAALFTFNTVIVRIVFHNRNTLLRLLSVFYYYLSGNFYYILFRNQIIILQGSCSKNNCSIFTLRVLSSHE